jgi:hypothetical protein
MLHNNISRHELQLRMTWFRRRESIFIQLPLFVVWHSRRKLGGRSTHHPNSHCNSGNLQLGVLLGFALKRDFSIRIDILCHSMGDQSWNLTAWRNGFLGPRGTAESGGCGVALLATFYCPLQPSWARIEQTLWGKDRGRSVPDGSQERLMKMTIRYLSKLW